MKQIKLLLFISIILLSAQNIFAYDFYSKEIHKGFLYKKNMHLNISNRYGNISIIPVQQDSVTIDVKINVEHYEEDKANKLLDEIDVLFSKHGNTAKAKTTISNLFKTGLKFSIDYIVRMPNDVKLDINHKFGNLIFEGDIENETHLDIEYGKVQIGKIKCQDTLTKHIFKLNYAEAEIKKCDNLKLLANYSKVKINNSKQLIVASKFTKLSLDTNAYLIANCNSDTYLINQTKSANILKGLNSNISINKLQERAEIKLKKGNINISTIEIFKYINLATEDVNTNITISDNSPYIFDLNHTHCEISYPLDAEIVTSQNDEFNGINILKGIYGDKGNIKSSIKIKANKGKINIK